MKDLPEYLGSSVVVETGGLRPGTQRSRDGVSRRRLHSPLRLSPEEVWVKCDLLHPRVPFLPGVLPTLGSRSRERECRGRVQLSRLWRRRTTVQGGPTDGDVSFPDFVGLSTVHPDTSGDLTYLP